MNIFSSFTLKVMALIFMLMDHMYSMLPNDFNIPIWFGYIGRISAPIFFYLVVEGFFYTKSRKKYISRVFLMGLLMIFIDIIFKINNNIFLSIGCSLLTLTGIDIYKNSNESFKKLKGILITLLFIILGLFTEASIYGVGMTLIFYLFKNNKKIMFISYILLSLFGIFSMIGPNFIEAIMLWDYQWMMVFAIIPISMYNGKLGFNNKFVKWIFYWFYPIHLVVINIISIFYK